MGSSWRTTGFFLIKLSIDYINSAFIREAFILHTKKYSSNGSDMFLRRTLDCLPLASLDTMAFRGSAYLPSQRREASCALYQNGRHADRRVSTSFSFLLSLSLSFDTTERVLRIQRVPQKEKLRGWHLRRKKVTVPSAGRFAWMWDDASRSG